MDPANPIPEITTPLTEEELYTLFYLEHHEKLPHLRPPAGFTVPVSAATGTKSAAAAAVKPPPLKALANLPRNLHVACSDTESPTMHLEAAGRAFFVKELSALPANCSNCERSAVARKTMSMMRELLLSGETEATAPCAHCRCEFCSEFC